MCLIIPEINKITFQIFLEELKKHKTEKQMILILDNASWHKTISLNWGEITPLFLPAYSPDLNPIERIWLNMKNKFFLCFTAINYKSLRRRLTKALKYFINNPDICKSICGGGQI